MWMTMMMHINSNNNSDEANLRRKLRPLMPRPIYSPPSCSCCSQNPNNMLLSMSDGVGVKHQAVVSTRWNPTAEQLQALEEMYRRGIRTPSAEQIQQIAAKLRRFGKIEGKNVFYWFQNHKARERQKKRRQLDLLAGKKMHHRRQTPPPAAGISRRSFETEHHMKVPIPSNCTTPPLEDSASMHAAVLAPECVKKDGWTHKDLDLKVAIARPTCWQFDSSSSSPSSRCIAGACQGNTDRENQATLELFPSPTSPRRHIIHIPPHTFTNVTPTHFFEFLPIKN